MNDNKVDKFNSTYFSGKTDGVVHAGMLELMNANNDTLAISYNNKMFASYSSVGGFLSNYCALPEQELKFYEVLCGHVHTYAHLEWNESESTEADIVDAFERLFWDAAAPLLQIEKREGEIIWSSNGKGSLHFKFELQNWSWRNTTEQRVFWLLIRKHLKKNRYEYRALFDDDRCVLDLDCYSKNQSWKCIGSNDSDGVLTPYGERLPLYKYFVTVEEPEFAFEMNDIVELYCANEEALEKANFLKSRKWEKEGC